MRCDLGGWSQFTAPGPAARQGHTLVWDASTESALLFGGQASLRFEYFSDVFRYSWPLRSWSQVLITGPSPGSRSGHSAVWDAASRTMLVFGGRQVEVFKADLWLLADGAAASWQQLVADSPPAARAEHTAVWDDATRTMLVFAGRKGGQALSDLHRYSAADDAWSRCTEASPKPRSRHTAVWDAVTRSMLVFGGFTGHGLSQK